ncbi:vitamin K-dependent gamma-carboxylase [Gracilibacillus halophilus YIM-C55.5]|uniref:Vitamin K-dependent gamma-carboxylase n=1 Tax=Gracilibacillus halophilus YIM-C55.5 TaxID=1308866 RepID=N4WPF6_9BACI|nr:DCC1-like thiol-disulfide oxidoreductase family protein [Gracilibacillus halophilus]ENH96365.1 vitamin K-dependent gamma-carboxylase [Gracilibacillus halophilus YIM-C55.5]
MYKYSESIVNFFSTERFTIGTSLLRVSFGLIILYNYVVLFSQRHFLFTDHGYHTFDKNSISLYNLSDSLIFFDIMYNTGIILAFLYTIGIKSRLINIINFIFYYSLYARFYHIGDGGDNLMVIVLFFMVFTNCTKYFSVSSTQKNKYKKGLGINTFYKNACVIFHNFAVFFIIGQMILVYFISATYQLMGETWATGTAIYYISQVKTMSSPLLENLSTNFVYLSVLLTYISIFIKYAFVFLIFNKRSKLVIIPIMCLFHIGIAIGMQLYTFSLIMISVEAILFTNTEYKQLYTKVRKLKILFFKHTRKFSKRYIPNQKICVFYDGECSFCLTTVRRLKQLDWFRLISLINFRNYNNIKKWDIYPENLEERMHSITIKSNKVKSGFDAFIEVTKHLVPLWFLLPILYLFKWVGMGNITYNFIAKRRNLLSSHYCNSESCLVSTKRGKK